MRSNPRLTVAFVVIATWPACWALSACTVTSPPADVDGEASTDGNADHIDGNAGPEDGGCPFGMTLAFTTGDCDASPVCIGPQDACATIMCGCDGKKFWGGCGGGNATKPWQPIASCADAAQPDAL